MNSKKTGNNWIRRALVFFVAINIIGDVGNVAFWWASPDSRAASLNTGILGTALGMDNALIAGSVILLVVAVVYAAALFGLFKEQKWAPLLVIAISVVNRVLALLIYFISAAFAFWAIWTVILVAVAFLYYRKLSAPAPAPLEQKTQA